MPLEAAHISDLKARLVCVVLDFQQDKQRRYTETLRCLRATIFAVKKQ